MSEETDLDIASLLDYSEILSNPTLDIGARVWEDDRYEAFNVYYGLRFQSVGATSNL